jgi:branched-chain amino acid transport system ATP-binding protein
LKTLLEVKNLKVRYGNIEALHGISFDVKEGEIVTLIGANGAGKSTTLLSICRLPPPEAPRVTEGDILYKGQSLLDMPPHKVVSDLDMALVPEGRRIFGNLTVEENLKIATYARKDGHEAVERDFERVFQLFPRLAERRKQRSESLSGGEQQMLAVGRALMRDRKSTRLNSSHRLTSRMPSSA